MKMREKSFRKEKEIFWNLPQHLKTNNRKKKLLSFSKEKLTKTWTQISISSANLQGSKNNIAFLSRKKSNKKKKKRNPTKWRKNSPMPFVIKDSLLMDR